MYPPDGIQIQLASSRQRTTDTKQLDFDFSGGVFCVIFFPLLVALLNDFSWSDFSISLRALDGAR